MILKILDFRKGEPANELMLEQDSFLIQSIPIKLAKEAMFFVNSSESESCWMIAHGDISYAFDVAYLMNNDGKTIQKYG